MSLELPYGLKPLVQKANIDERYGPYSSISEALAGTTGTRELGLTVGIIEKGEVVEYWFKSGIEDKYLVKKIVAFKKINSSQSWNGLNYEIDLNHEDLDTLVIDDGVTNIAFSLLFAEDSDSIHRKRKIIIDNSSNTSAISTIVWIDNGGTYSWNWSDGDPINGIAIGGKVLLEVENISDTEVFATAISIGPAAEPEGSYYGIFNGSSYVQYNNGSITFTENSKIEIEFYFNPGGLLGPGDNKCIGSLSQVLSDITAYKLFIFMSQNAADGFAPNVVYQLLGESSYQISPTSSQYSKLYAENTFNKYYILIDFENDSCTIKVDDSTVCSGTSADLITPSSLSIVHEIGYSSSYPLPLKGWLKDYKVRIDGVTNLAVSRWDTCENIRDGVFDDPIITGTITNEEYVE
jgi:hypothetical protein